MSSAFPLFNYNNNSRNIYKIRYNPSDNLYPAGKKKVAPLVSIYL